MPIREALGRLASEGLVIVVPHRGAQVRPLNAEDLQDLWILRVTLESMAGRLGAERIADDDLRRMRDLVPTMNAVVERNDPIAWLEVDSTFHTTLYAAAGHPRLAKFIQTLREEASRYRRIGLGMPGELKLSLDGHHRILAACSRRNGEEVERIIRTEVERSRDKLLALLREQLD